MKILYDADDNLFPGILYDKFVKFLPPNLTELHTPDTIQHDHGSTVALPKSLTLWPTYHVCHPLERDPPLPETWQSLVIPFARDCDIFQQFGPGNQAKYLPAALQDLHLKRSRHMISSGLAKLPSKLTRLRLGYVSVLSIDMLRMLPASLLTLDVIARSLKSEKNDVWLHAWPPRLRTLLLRTFDPELSIGAGFWASFAPLPLETLDIRLEELSFLPSTLELLLTTTTSLKLAQEKSTEKRDD